MLAPVNLKAFSVILQNTNNGFKTSTNNCNTVCKPTAPDEKECAHTVCTSAAKVHTRKAAPGDQKDNQVASLA